MGVHRSNDEKKRQWGYTGTIIENYDLKLKKNFLRDIFLHKFSPKIVSIGVHKKYIENSNMNFKKNIFYARSFLHEIILKIISIGVHRNDNKNKKLQI